MHIKNKLATRNKPPLNGNNIVRDGLPKLGAISACYDFVVSAFKPKGPKLIGSEVNTINRGVFRDEAPLLHIEKLAKKAPLKKDKISIEENQGRNPNKSFVAGKGDAIRPRGTILKGTHEDNKVVHTRGGNVIKLPFSALTLKKTISSGRYLIYLRKSA